MSTVFDAASVTIAQLPVANFGTVISSIAITVPTTVASVNITAPNTAASVDVTVPGPQGPPGFQNVYVQASNPAVQFNWGPAQEGYIWGQIV